MTQKKCASADVILSENCCSEESRRTLWRPALITQKAPQDCARAQRRASTCLIFSKPAELLFVEAGDSRQLIRELDPRHAVRPEGMAKTGLRMPRLGSRFETRARNRYQVRHRVDIDSERRAAVLASVTMNLGRAAEGLKVAALGPAKAGTWKDRERDEGRAMQPPAVRAVAMMRVDRWLGHLELVRSAITRPLGLFEIRHSPSSLLGASQRSCIE